MDIFLIIFGLFYPSFQIWIRRVEDNSLNQQFNSVTDPQQKEKIKKKFTRANRRSLRWIQYFCVICIYIIFTMVFNQIFGDFLIYTLLRTILLFWLVKNDAMGSATLFNAFTNYLQIKFPFIMSFAESALDEKIGFDAQIKIIFTHLVKMFQDEYFQTFNSIEIIYPK